MIYMSKFSNPTLVSQTFSFLFLVYVWIQNLSPRDNTLKTLFFLSLIYFTNYTFKLMANQMLILFRDGMSSKELSEEKVKYESEKK